MKLTDISDKEDEIPVLVDVPVEVHTSEVLEDKVSVRTPWKIVMISLSVIVFVFLIGAVVWVMVGRGGGPDLELKAPERSIAEGGLIETEQDNLPQTLSSSPYVSIIENYQITPPEGWVLDNSRKSGNYVVFLSPVPKNINERNYATLISIETESSANLDLSDQVEVIKRGVAETYPDFRYENDLELFLGGRLYYLIGGVYYDDEVQIRRRSLITIYDNRGYAISVSGPVDSWDEYEDVVTESMYSFKIL